MEVFEKGVVISAMQIDKSEGLTAVRGGGESRNFRKLIRKSFSQESLPRKKNRIDIHFRILNDNCERLNLFPLFFERAVHL